MDWHFALATLAGAIGVISIIPYVHDVLKGTTRPNIVSMSIWFLLEAIAVGSWVSVGASWSLVICIVTALNSGIVVVLCLFGYGYRAYATLDVVCLVFGLLAILLWQLADRPLVAVVLVVLADLIATIPTIRKLAIAPDSEDPLAWGLLTLAAVLAAVSTAKLDFINLFYPVFLILQAGTIAVLGLRGRRALS